MAPIDAELHAAVTARRSATIPACICAHHVRRTLTLTERFHTGCPFCGGWLTAEQNLELAGGDLEILRRSLVDAWRRPRAVRPPVTLR